MKVPALENFRRNLRTAMRVKGLTQTRLAELTQTQNPYINRVLQGKCSPSLEQCEKLAKATGYPLVALISSPETFDEATVGNTSLTALTS